MMCNRPKAAIRGGEVSAQLLWLHPLPALEPAAEAHVDVAVVTVRAVVPESASARDEFLAHHHAPLALEAHEAGLAVAAAHAPLPLPLPVQRHTGANRSRFHVDTDGPVAAVLVARALLLVAGVILQLLQLVRHHVLYFPSQHSRLPKFYIML